MAQQREEGSGYGAELTFFSDRDRVNSAIRSVCSEAWASNYTSDQDSLALMLGKYQEQSTLLNPYLEELISPLFSKILDIAMPICKRHIDLKQASSSQVRWQPYLDVSSSNEVFCVISDWMPPSFMPSAKSSS